MVVIDERHSVNIQTRYAMNSSGLSIKRGICSITGEEDVFDVTCVSFRVTGRDQSEQGG
jgi:hypothetical protein